MPISFVPPLLENATYSLGIYEAKSGKLIRRLREIAPQNAFTMGLNGLVTSWDGKDDEGNKVPPGRYTAHGYAVGPMKVKGIEILGNDWNLEDEKLKIQRVAAIAFVPEDEGIVIVALGNYDGLGVLRYAGKDGHLLWRKTGLVTTAAGYSADSLPPCGLKIEKDVVLAIVGGHTSVYGIADGDPPDWDVDTNKPAEGKPSVDKDGSHWEIEADALVRFSASGEVLRRINTNPGLIDPKLSVGKDGTHWQIEDGAVLQISASGEVLRRLSLKPSDPVPVQVSASTKSDRIYLLENSPKWQRVRGLSLVDTKEEAGTKVSTWQTFFERNIRPIDPAVGIADVVQIGSWKTFAEIDLVANPLDPTRKQKVKLTGGYENGSYLITTDGLRLRQITRMPTLMSAFRLVMGKGPDTLLFYEYDGTAWNEYSVEGVKNMMAFDAGEIEMGAEGEKTHAEKAAGPPDL